VRGNRRKRRSLGERRRRREGKERGWRGGRERGRKRRERGGRWGSPAGTRERTGREEGNEAVTRCSFTGEDRERVSQKERKQGTICNFVNCNFGHIF